MVIKQLLSALLYTLGAVIGVAALLYPFAFSQAAGSAALAPLLTMALLGVCLAAIMLEIQGEVANVRVVAALGVLIAIASALRFLETAIPGPGGFSPIFAPIILAGYVFGARFGFLMGALTLFVSALVTGGVGPWLPYQMFVSAWLGFTAGWLPHPRSSGWQLSLLGGFGFAWGFLYGAITNLYFWPFFAGAEGLQWQPGLSLGEGLAHYAAFYLATSLVWDLTRALGNVVLLVAVGVPAARALFRFRDRLQFCVEEARPAYERTG
ncbi:MAG: ECF transporter S component [Candidatus Promineifilaceae bacterium]|nr:ECF transporter S component [Candidatus Promineifilaceae bacterium]